MYIKKEPAITDSGANDFINLIYGTYNMGFDLDCFGIMVSILCAILGGICMKRDTSKALGRMFAYEVKDTAAAPNPAAAQV